MMPLPFVVVSPQAMLPEDWSFFATMREAVQFSARNGGTVYRISEASAPTATKSLLGTGDFLFLLSVFSLFLLSVFLLK